MTQAEYLISRFGGLSSMARAIGVVPTVVQGWKDRGCLPGKRIGEVLIAGQALSPPLTESEFFRQKDGTPHAIAAKAA